MKRNILLLAFILIVMAAIVFVLPALVKDVFSNTISAQARRAVIQTFTIIVVCVLGIVYFSSGAHKREESGMWVTAITLSVFCLTGIGLIWYMVSRSSSNENSPAYYHIITPSSVSGVCEKIDLSALDSQPSKGNPINVRFIDAKADVDCLMNEQSDLASQMKGEAPIYIPTGVFIQSLKFDSANDVILTGFVWQRYANDVPAEIERGFVIPEGDSEIFVREDTAVYKKQQGNETLYGWYINISLRQVFDYSHYPFDRQDIWLRLWHLNFDRNVILVPDFSAYHLESVWPQDGKTFPGIERDFVLERLSLERTYFSYHYNHYNTNFGIDSYDAHTVFPELYFNVGVRRDVLDAFVAYMIPMFILILMSFGVQFIVTQDPEKMTMHGISTTGLIAYYASLFFIGILAQLDIRRTLNAPGVVYIEYFYFVLYIILLLQTVNSVVFAASDRVEWLEYKDNLIPKVVFFPVTLGLMYLITAFLFY
ncbi:MAG TPA: hypothetical protein PLN43_09730 [Anaerolineales bacterium]|nr:hypothetical protein [Anaerolineales bacterium]